MLTYEEEKEIKKINPNIKTEYRMYGQTNEDLDALFKNYDFKDKEVLSVLGSSDQMFTSYYHGAKHVDTFDRSIMAIYYYYFRKWLISEFDEIYPYFRFNRNDYLKMVNEVYPTNTYEAEAKKFWQMILSKKFNEYDYFEYIPYCQRNEFEKDKNFIKRIFNKELTYYNIDMFEPVSLNKKYDIIILSNMIEYLEYNRKGLENIKANIEGLLKDDGIAICSFIVHDHFSEGFLCEKAILSKGDLSFDKYFDYYEPLYGRVTDSGYSYKLKKN